MAFDAAAGELRFRVVQFPGQAGATKGFSRGGARKEALRFCAGFINVNTVINNLMIYSDCVYMCAVETGESHDICKFCSA